MSVCLSVCVCCVLCVCVCVWYVFLPVCLSVCLLSIYLSVCYHSSGDIVHFNARSKVRGVFIGFLVFKFVDFR